MIMDNNNTNKTVAFLPSDRKTQTTLDRINIEFEQHKHDYEIDLALTYPTTPKTAKSVIKNAFIKARNNAGTYDKSMPLHDWIESFILEELAEHQSEQIHKETMEQDTQESQRLLAKEIDTAMNQLMQQGQTEHQALWTLIRFFKAINQEHHNKNISLENISDEQIAEYQRELIHVLTPEARIIPFTKSENLLKYIENQENKDPEPQNDLDTNSPS